MDFNILLIKKNQDILYAASKAAWLVLCQIATLKSADGTKLLKDQNNISNCLGEYLSNF